MHYNSLFRTQYPQFKPFGWFKPSILQVRVPLLGTKNETAHPPRSDPNSSLVSDILDRGYVDKLSQATIAALVAWDFSLGMVFACIITQKKDEDLNCLLQRMEPNLFLHVTAWVEDPGDSPVP
jgi:hypothetical protein